MNKMTREQAFRQAFARVAREVVVCGECGRRATYEDMLYCEKHEVHTCLEMYPENDQNRIDMACYLQHMDCPQ